MNDEQAQVVAPIISVIGGVLTVVVTAVPVPARPGHWLFTITCNEQLCSQQVALPRWEPERETFVVPLNDSLATEGVGAGGVEEAVKVACDRLAVAESLRQS